MRLRLAAAQLLAVLILLEGALRLYPQAIPMFLLVQFNPELRAEVAARLGYQSQRNEKYVSRSDGGPPLWMTMPGQDVRTPMDDRDAVQHVTMDWNGFCNPPTKARVDFRPRTLVVGDSFSWCLGVTPDQTWIAELERQGGFATYAVSRPATGPYEYVQMLSAFGLAMQPRQVVMTIYEGNDMRDVRKYWEFRNRPAASAAPAKEAQQRPGLAGRAYAAVMDGPAGRSSYAAATLLSGLNVGLNALRGPSAKDRREEEAASVDFRYDLVFDGRTVPFNTANTDTDEVDSARSLAARPEEAALMDPALEAFAGMVRSAGAEPVFVYMPSAQTVYEGKVRWHDATSGRLVGEASSILRRHVSATAGRLGARFVDLVPDMRAAAETAGAENLLYFPVNLHLTREGHAAVARILARELAR
jgi:hypothetical protein